MTDEQAPTDGESTDGRTVGQPRAPAQFHPEEVARLIEQAVTDVSNRHVGAVIGMAYGHLTNALFLGLWAGSVYLFTYSLDFVNYSRNLALITITIGTFVLMAGANLIEKFGEQALNFRAYIHNSITFIASGIAFLLGFISRQIVVNYSFEPPLDVLAQGWLLVLNIVSSFLFLIAIWVLLKLLWRLDRLLSHEDDFHRGKDVYGEFRASIEGLSADPSAEPLGEGGPSTATGLLLSAIAVLALGGFPFLLTGDWRWAILVLALGYAGYATLRIQRGQL